MKRIVLALVVLMLTAPAMADVVVEANQVGDTNEIAITYLVTGEPNHVRAFALDISVTDGNIVSIKDFFVGECTSDSNGYGIFMGSIDLTDVNIPVWNNPVAPITHPNAAGEIPGPAITVEMGSLYKGAPNAPADSGLLCTIVVSDCNATVNLVEEGRRGGITMENGNPPTGTVYLYGDALECAQQCMKASHLAYNRWLGGTHMANEVPPLPTAPWSEPDCWCYPRHCRADADGAPIAPGVAMWVSLADLSLLRSALSKMYTDPVNWPTGGECCDFDKAMIAPGVAMPVSLADLSILRTYLSQMDVPPSTVVPCCDNDANCVLEPSDDFNFWTGPTTP